MKRGFLILMVLLTGIMLFTPMAFGEDIDQSVTDQSVTITSDTVQPITPTDGANRLKAAFNRLYVAGASVVPSIGLIALLVGAVMVMFAAMLSLEKLLKASLLGMAAVLVAIAIVYAAPFLTSMAQGIGQGL